MNINDFMFTFINELNENLFYEVELHKEFNNCISVLFIFHFLF